MPCVATRTASSCTSCHTRNECSDCHEGASVQATLPGALAGPTFHPPNFMARHASQAYGRQLECSNCHDTAAFCRECHPGREFAD